MKINYQPKKLEKTTQDFKAISKNYGTRAKKVIQRLEEMKAAENLEILRKIPAARCHELKENFKGYLAVDISGNHRIFFKPDHDPPPKKDDGGLDWTTVTAITITAIGEDYH
ncbi:MAG: type II toxin-antitoxin system RelE/ParE family toxin [Mongoliitalea sp.]